MAKDNKGVIEHFKETVVQAIEGTGDIVNAFIDILGAAVQETIKTTGATGKKLINFLSDMVETAIRGVVEMGGDLGRAARGMTIGVLRAVGAMGQEALDFIGEFAHLLVKHTARVGGDLGTTAKGLIEGVIDAAKDLGLNVEEAVSEAATGAVKAAYEISAEVGDKLRDALKGSIGGIKVILKEPFRKNHKDRYKEDAA
ncbi:MAG: hypothetical protein HY585_00935 [Candidatus Omnitrophica bacterium]|nr:hypothetical protein [Candidatus Omnitrophota bacterium]